MLTTSDNNILINDSARRIWFITDTHFGVRNNSNDWIEIMRDYFEKWFIPMVKENYKPGDILIHLGDVYDSRQSLNIKVLNLGVSIFESLSEIFKDGIYVIAGNHDLWGKNSNEVNSLKSIKWIPRVNVIENPLTLKIGDKNLFMMPWRANHDEEAQTLETVNPHDILCCHADIRGLKFNKYTTVEEGASVEKLKKIKLVYSGHIHYSQKTQNVRMLGSPYELTRSDIDNPKFILLLDLENLEEKVFVNEFSPKFKKLYFNDIIEKTPEDMLPVFNNNFIDIMIDPSMSMKTQLSLLTEIITSYKTLNFHPWDPNQATTLSDQMFDSEGKQFDVLDFIKDYISCLEEEPTVKDKMITSLSKLYSIVINQEN
jgi:DNA repair exonuclease SbcCD nuclease subunit